LLYSAPPRGKRPLGGSNPAAERETENGIGRVMADGGGAQNDCAVRVISTLLDLRPAPMYLPSSRRSATIAVENSLRGIAVRLVAAGLGGLIRHVPGQLESLMQRHVGRRMGCDALARLPARQIWQGR
jgi:hypothetical protein